VNDDSAVASRRALALCEELGFACAGVAEATASRWGKELRAWLEAGRHGSMGYLARHVEERLDPGRVLPGARSAVMVADVYASQGAGHEQRLGGRDADGGRRGIADGPRAGGTGGTGKIARYARGRDYHVVMKKRLHVLCDRMREEFPEGGFRGFVDTAPVLEREYGARAGLGWVGKHTLLIHPQLGSWFFLGGVLTTLSLEPAGTRVEDHCGTCTRCIDACPTGAISPYSVDASRCISYLTIERRLPIEGRFHEAMGEWVYGCDVCQEVCPHNSTRGRSGGARPEYASEREGFSLLEVLGWDEEARRGAMRGSAMKRATLAMMKRNAIIVAGNRLRRGRDEGLLRRLREVAEDCSETKMVRGTAAEVVSRMDTGS
jgi:epoxyqueuosine reductase